MPAVLPVLVLDADQASALAIVRALGRHGIAVQVASDGPLPLAGYSRHAQAVQQYPDPLRRESEFVDWLESCLLEDRYAFVIPVTERTVVPILRHRARFDDRRIAMAPSEALEQALDKERTVQLAQSLGIPVPRSITLDSMDQLTAAALEIGYPVVVKPSRSVGQDATRRVQLSVSYAHNAEELESQVQHALRYGSVILQEYFRGEGVGIELIADHGSVRYAFQHRRLHEVPLTGGGSSLRVSEAVVPALRTASEQMVRAMGWHGVAMIEFKYVPASGEFRLMEINGRFWGSLPLAIAAGADFPLMLYQLMTTGQVADHAPARNGVLCRQLARDIDWLEHVLRRAAPPQLVRLPSRLEVLRDSLLVFSPRHHFDVQSLRDPRPGLVDLWRIGKRQALRLSGAWAQRRRLASECRAGQSGGIGRRHLAQAHRVLFLCYGNINRSALAHAYAESRHAGRFEFVSAGFHVPGGRPADPVMVEVAAGQGIDLARWRSCALSESMVREADLILAMEVAHLDRLLVDHPTARGKAFLLGASTATGRHDAEVRDPYGQPRNTYDRVCQQVIAAVDGWFIHPTRAAAGATPR
jgi:protein-tyrosine-phosphatase/predicted ATP-grasp superfamily ATP-dependent carboligase